MDLRQYLSNYFTDAFDHVNVSIIIGLVTLAIIVLYKYSVVPKNLPPGPPGLPIVGYLPFLGRKPYETFNKLANKYGPVFSLYFGNRLIVVLNSYEAIKEAFVRQGEVFAGRPPMQMTVADKDVYSIPMTDGDVWKTHRRFALNVLRDLGVGKLNIEPLITDEIKYFINELKKYNGEPTDFSEHLAASVANNICILIFGKRFEYDDPWFVSAKNLFNEAVMVSSSVGVMNFFPWLMKMPFIDKVLNQGTLLEHMKEFKESINSRITEMKKHHVDGHRDNYMNAFIAEQKTCQKKEKNITFFPDKALEENVSALMGAGTETTTNTLLWAILYMTLNPSVQKKVQKEIDDTIGAQRAPCWNDRLRTPYTEATLNEVQRIATLLPTNLPHRNTKECELFGYNIPKDTFVISNLWAVHNDEKLWKNPAEFRPERFLGANGEILKNEHLIPFSMGKRECLGISLARMELYLYFTSLLQKFTFNSPDGSATSLEPKSGLTYGPKYFNIMTVIRDKA